MLPRTDSVSSAMLQHPKYHAWREETDRLVSDITGRFVFHKRMLGRMLKQMARLKEVYEKNRVTFHLAGRLGSLDATVRVTRRRIRKWIDGVNRLRSLFLFPSGDYPVEIPDYLMLLPDHLRNRNLPFEVWAWYEADPDDGMFQKLELADLALFRSKLELHAVDVTDAVVQLVLEEFSKVGKLQEKALTAAKVMHRRMANLVDDYYVDESLPPPQVPDPNFDFQNEDYTNSEFDSDPTDIDTDPYQTDSDDSDDSDW